MGKQSRKLGLFYDFDLTLSEEYQQYPIFRHFSRKLERFYGITKPEQYWQLCAGAELGVGYMEQIVKDAGKVFKGLTNTSMRETFAPQIQLAPGVIDWFDRIAEFCKLLSEEETPIIIPEHHVVSVGITPLIEGTQIGPKLDSVKSCEFVDDGEEIYKIKNLLDPFRKIEAIKARCKGGDDKTALHRDISHDEYNIHYANCMVFGDGFTDSDMFRYLQQRGGIAIAVYKSGNRADFNKAAASVGNSVNFVVARDYSEGTMLEEVVKQSIALIQSACDMDYSIINKLLINRLPNTELRDLATTHLRGCTTCQERSKTRFYFGDTLEKEIDYATPFMK